VEDGLEKAQFASHPEGVASLAFQPRGHVLATSGIEGKVCLWDPARGTGPGELKDEKSPVAALAFSPDGTRLAVGSDNGSIDLWEVGSRKSLGSLPDTPGKPVRGLAFSADGQTIVAATKRGGETADLLTWIGPKWRPAPTLSLGATEGYCLAVSPDRTTFVVGCQNNTAKVYETATRRELQTLRSDHPFLCLAFSPDGRYLATSGGWFGPVQLWEAE
jgi:WD40 repeat protein